MSGHLRNAAVQFFRFVGIGALTLTPLIVTVWLVSLVVSLLARLGAVLWRPVSGMTTIHPSIDALPEVLVALVGLAVVGALANSVVGRWIGSGANRLVDQVPVAKTIYRGVQKLLWSFQSSGEDTRKVVLIEFPSPHMKTIGLVTRRFTAAETGQALAAVYVPTTPNPSSGYIEIVPVDRLVWLDWSAQEAIQFIMSGGVIGPDQIYYDPRGEPPAR